MRRNDVAGERKKAAGDPEAAAEPTKKEQREALQVANDATMGTLQVGGGDVKGETEYERAVRIHGEPGKGE
jgi:hypothetical protein